MKCIEVTGLSSDYFLTRVDVMRDHSNADNNDAHVYPE